MEVNRCLTCLGIAGMLSAALAIFWLSIQEVAKEAFIYAYRCTNSPGSLITLRWNAVWSQTTWTRPMENWCMVIYGSLRWCRDLAVQIDTTSCSCHGWLSPNRNSV